MQEKISQLLFISHFHLHWIVTIHLSILKNFISCTLKYACSYNFGRAEVVASSRTFHSNGRRRRKTGADFWTLKRNVRTLSGRCGSAFCGVRINTRLLVLTSTLSTPRHHKTGQTLHRWVFLSKLFSKRQSFQTLIESKTNVVSLRVSVPMRLARTQSQCYDGIGFI